MTTPAMRTVGRNTVGPIQEYEDELGRTVVLVAWPDSTCDKGYVMLSLSLIAKRLAATDPGDTPVNLNVCTTCGAMVREPNTYHPHAFCVLVKAGLDPEQVVHEAVRFYEKYGWPEAQD